jgi:hypothetical protein
VAPAILHGALFSAALQERIDAYRLAGKTIGFAGTVSVSEIRVGPLAPGLSGDGPFPLAAFNAVRWGLLPFRPVAWSVGRSALTPLVLRGGLPSATANLEFRQHEPRSLESLRRKTTLDCNGGRPTSSAGAPNLWPT